MENDDGCLSRGISYSLKDDPAWITSDSLEQQQQQHCE
jgi:hypothetical protein